MRQSDIQKLVEDTQTEILQGARRIAVLNVSDAAVEVLRQIDEKGLLSAVVGLYAISTDMAAAQVRGVPVRPMVTLRDDLPEVIVVAADDEKEEVIAAALPYVQGCPKMIVAGCGHYSFRDPLFDEISAQLLVPSLANGYKNSLVHLYQCLSNAARLGLDGVVAEFGVYKGGTTMFIASLLERLGVGWQVLGFDTFAGFPQRRSPLDMYDHPGCIFTNLAAVRTYLSKKNIEIVVGDIAETCQQLTAKNLVVTFMDTDNYTPARAALEIVQDRTVVNGAIVFDHFTGDDRFRYTLGERLAAKVLLADDRYFNLHGTGVFIRQR